MPAVDHFMNRRDVAAELHIGPRILDSLIKSGGFPKPIELGYRTKVWKRSTIEQWIAAQGNVEAA